MSNYPPGVTGMEPQIRGCDEAEAEVECDSYGKVWVVNKTDIEFWVAEAFRRIRDGKSVAGCLSNIQADIEMGFEVEVDCEFKGKVDAQFMGVRLWTCPLCNTEHEDEPDEEGYF